MFHYMDRFVVSLIFKIEAVEKPSGAPNLKALHYKGTPC
jgi:hypothetical protein